MARCFIIMIALYGRTYAGWGSRGFRSPSIYPECYPVRNDIHVQLRRPYFGAEKSGSIVRILWIALGQNRHG